MKAQLLRVYERFQENDNVVLLSHTIDVRHDSVPVLKRYADKLEVSSPKWHFVTGDEDEIYSIAREYFCECDGGQIGTRRVFAQRGICAG